MTVVELIERKRDGGRIEGGQLHWDLGLVHSNSLRELTVNAQALTLDRLAQQAFNLLYVRGFQKIGGRAGV